VHWNHKGKQIKEYFVCRREEEEEEGKGIWHRFVRSAVWMQICTHKVQKRP
jgi:hypothetical protein